MSGAVVLRILGGVVWAVADSIPALFTNFVPVNPPSSLAAIHRADGWDSLVPL